MSSYRVTIEQTDATTPSGQPASEPYEVYAQSFEDLDLSDTIRLLNQPKRKPRRDRGSERKRKAAQP